MKKITWRQINSQNVPQSSGIYAWYYEHNLSVYDIEGILNIIKETEDLVLKKEHLKNFLKKYIFSHYEEDPYEAVVKGKLKASYKGKLYHQQEVSDSLVNRIIENPGLLLEIKDVFSEVSHSFTSPLYIGMAKKLLVRLQKHKTLIERYRVDGVPRSFNSDNYDDVRDHNFAARVVDRGFSETNLYVVVKEVKEEYALNNVLENVLNRINYPILGRN